MPSTCICAPCWPWMGTRGQDSTPCCPYLADFAWFTVVPDLLLRLLEVVTRPNGRMKLVAHCLLAVAIMTTATTAAAQTSTSNPGTDNGAGPKQSAPASTV